MDFSWTLSIEQFARCSTTLQFLASCYRRGRAINGFSFPPKQLYSALATSDASLCALIPSFRKNSSNILMHRSARSLHSTLAAWIPIFHFYQRSSSDPTPMWDNANGKISYVRRYSISAQLAVERRTRSQLNKILLQDVRSKLILNFLFRIKEKIERNPRNR